MWIFRKRNAVADDGRAGVARGAARVTGVFAERGPARVTPDFVLVYI
jgi:hypothetical protein